MDYGSDDDDNIYTWIMVIGIHLSYIKKTLHYNKYNIRISQVDTVSALALTNSASI